MARSKKKAKKSTKAKIGYRGGEVRVIQTLEYDGHTYKEIGEDTVDPIGRIGFDDKTKIAYGEASCGQRNYFATSAAEAQAVIDFLKSSYGI